MSSKGFLPATVLLLSMAANGARVFPGFNNVASARHPSLGVPLSARATAHVITDGDQKWSSTGNVSYKLTKLLWLTAVSDHIITFDEKQPGGVDRRHTMFVGWNNILTRMVDRYLFVTDFDQEKELRSECYTYTDERPQGFWDPFEQVESNFDLVRESPEVDLWKTPKITTSHGTQMLGRMFTEAGGKNALNTTIVSTEKNHKSTYSIVYSDRAQSAIADHDELVYKYQEMTCTTVSGFQNMPEVCVDDLLALEYGCGYAELREKS